MATEQEDRQKYLPSSRALHNRHFPSSKVVLGLISAVPTPLNVYFNISSMWQAKMKEVCSSQRRKAQDWSGELLKFWVKTRSFLWCGQSLCCTFHHCSHVLHLPWQGLSLGLGRTRTMSKSATACGLQLRQPLRGLNWITAPNTVLGHNQAGSRSRSSLDDEILLWVKMLIFAGRQCYTRHVCSSFTALAAFPRPCFPKL